MVRLIRSDNPSQSCLTSRVQTSCRTNTAASMSCHCSFYIWRTDRRPLYSYSFWTLQEDRWRSVWCWPPCCRGYSYRQHQSDCSLWRRLCTPALRRWRGGDKPIWTRPRPAGQNTWWVSISVLDSFTHQLEEVGNDGEEQTGEHRTHRFGSLLYQCNGDLNSLQEEKNIDLKITEL